VDQQDLNIVLSSIAVLTGAIAAVASVAGIWLSVRHNRQRGREREEDRRLVEEQLALAREQSGMRPHLWVRDIRLLHPDDSEALEGSVDPPWVNMLRNIREVGPLAMATTFIQQRRLHDRSAEDKVVVVEVANEGKTAAHLMTGWVYLDARRLEPTKPSGGPDVSLEGGEYRVAVVGEEKATVVPPRRAVSLRVHVAVLSSGDTRIRYDFVSSEGGGARGDWKVSV
jgi:hypothetical protein